MKKIYSDLRSGILLFVISLLMYFVLIPAQISVKAGKNLAADFFPKLMVIVFGLCGLLLAATSAYDLYRHREQATKERAEGAWKTDYKVFLPHVIFLVSAIVYLVLLQHLGFVLSSIPFLIFLLWHFGSPSWGKNLVIAVVYVPIVYLIFSYGFRIRFPMGPLGF